MGNEKNRNYVSGNEIGPDGAKMLGDGLQNNSSLQKMMLGGIDTNKYIWVIDGNDHANW